MNNAMTNAVFDLGLGDGLKSQLQNEENERKKRLAQQASALQGYGSATQTLFGMNMGSVGGA